MTRTVGARGYVGGTESLAAPVERFTDLPVEQATQIRTRTQS
jgi:hypothetical protein